MRDGDLDQDGPVAIGPGAGSQVVLLSRWFTAATVTAVRHALAEQVAAAGLAGDESDDFVLAVHELVTNAVRHGGGAGELALRLLDDTLVCEVTDHGGAGQSLPVALPAADAPGGRGLWLAHQLTGALLLTRRPDGVTASVSVCVTPRAVTVDRLAAGAGDMPDEPAGEG